MRIFLIDWALEYPELVGVAEELQKAGHEILYWVRISDFSNYIKANKGLFPKTVFHELTEEADAAKPPAKVQTDSFEPVGEDIIHQLLEDEGVVLSLMERSYCRWSIHQKKQFYYDLLKYWRGVINLYKPEVIIFDTYPHSTYAYVIYILARLFKIKTIFFGQTWIVNDLILLYHSYKEEAPRLEKELNERKNILFDDLSPDLKKHYLSFNNNQDFSGLNEKMKRMLLEGRIKRKIKVLHRVIKRGQLISYFSELVRKSRDNLRKDYEKLQIDFDPSVNYVYFPLHLQPEASSCPLGGVFNNQLLALEILSAALPQNWVIYVKEHPHFWLNFGLGFDGYRFKGYYIRIAELKNVKIIPVALKSWEVIKQAKAVATLTGTAGWEALLRGKPVLTFGWPFYQNAPGVFKVSDLPSCALAMEKIAQGFKPEQQEVINFLAALDRASFQGYQSFVGKGVSKITPEENKRNFLKAILEELRWKEII
ncbi:MAG: hypothetical protein CMI54_03695 [Parcubacteria group bacterium]|nr:hypothetical protein [Parcubacteria group bacterium]|tara:strand:- start:24444 stop:25886 length:1443 start_codon:yes stop_codon:yes gene_type:complete